MLGPKGGIGKTLTSANLAVGAGRAGKRVVIVDLDLQFGDVGLSLGLTPQRTIYDLVKSGGSLDAEKIEAYLTRARERSARPHGARAAGPGRRGDRSSSSATLYPLLRATNDFVVVDTPPGFMPEVIASIDASTHVCLVGMLDSLSLKNTKLGLETLELMGYERERIRMVLNRADTNVGVTHEDVTRHRRAAGRRPGPESPGRRALGQRGLAGRALAGRARTRRRRSAPWPSFYAGRPAEGGRAARKLRRNR